MSERYNWETLVDRYPNKWLVLQDCEMHKGDIVSAVLVKVLTSAEVDNYMAQNVGKGYRYRKTSEETFGGLVTIENAETRLE